MSEKIIIIADGHVGPTFIAAHFPVGVTVVDIHDIPKDIQGKLDTEEKQSPILKIPIAEYRPERPFEQTDRIPVPKKYSRNRYKR